MSSVTKVRWGLDTGGGLRVSSSLEQIIMISWGKCLQSTMQVQVYLYPIFHPQWNDFIGGEF